MKEFNLSEWLKDKSRKVVTRDGREVKILKTNRKDGVHPIIFTLIDSNGIEQVHFCNEQGVCTTLPRPNKFDLFFADEDLEEEIKRYINEEVIVTNENVVISKHHEFHNFYVENLVDIARHFAEWQKQQDEKLFKEDTWNYIEEQYPDVTKEEKLRLYDVSIKSRLAGAKTQKKLDQVHRQRR